MSTGKQVKFAKPQRREAAPVATTDAWVNERQAPPAPAEPMKRLTIDVPVSLHARVKAGCALRGEKMADVMRRLLETEFPEAETKTS